jgi:hypothetical protein
VVRISCLKDVHEGIVTHIKLLAPDMLHRQLRDDVFYSPVDRLFVVASVLQLTWYVVQAYLVSQLLIYFGHRRDEVPTLTESSGNLFDFCGATTYLFVR